MSALLIDNVDAPSGTESLHKLLVDPVFSKVSRLDLARLLPYTSERILQPGQYLYRAGHSAEEFFYLLDGRVKLIAHGQRELLPGTHRLGEEAATDFDHYLSDAVALGPARVLVVSRRSLAQVFENHPELRAEFYFSLMRTLAGEQLPAASQEQSTGRPRLRRRIQESPTALVGWLLTLLAPASILYFGRDWELSGNALYFLAVFSATVVMRVSALVDEYIPGIFALLATLPRSSAGRKPIPGCRWLGPMPSSSRRRPEHPRIFFP